MALLTMEMVTTECQTSSVTDDLSADSENVTCDLAAQHSISALPAQLVYY